MEHSLQAFFGRALTLQQCDGLFLDPGMDSKMLKAEGPLPVEIETEVQRFLESRRLALTQELATVATLAESGKLPMLNWPKVTSKSRDSAAGPRATDAYIEFFTATIRNRNTRLACERACYQFLYWARENGLTLDTVRPFHVAAYIEQMPGSKQAIKQKLAAIRMLYDFLVIRQLVPVNPTASVRGPKYVVKRGKTPVWSSEDTKKLESIPRDDLAELRDRALISTMLFSFARISAVLFLKRQDFYYQGPRRWLRFHEKGGKVHEMPAHHEIEETIDEYLSKAKIENDQPLFQSVNKAGTALSGRALNRHNA
jgi:site-specific recombinase XerC